MGGGGTNLGLPHEQSNHVIFSPENYRPVRSIAANHRDEPFPERCVLCRDSFVETSFERSSDDPKMQARRIDVVYEVAEQHH